MSLKLSFDAHSTRQLIADLRQPATKDNLWIEQDETIHIPRGHLKALDWQSSVVVGARGVGKSFWTAVLYDSKGLHYLQQHPSASVSLRDLVVCVGFGLGNDSGFPSEDELSELRQQGIASRSIWQAVVLRHALKVAQVTPPFGSTIAEASNWVHQNAADTRKLFADADSALARLGQRLLVLFDSLERLANNWDDVRDHITEILRVALDCRSTRALRCKVFLRPDLSGDERIWQFAESSKLKQDLQKLDWRPIELYALVIVSMGNQPQYGAAFRAALTEAAKVAWIKQPEQVRSLTNPSHRYVLPDTFLGNEAQVRDVIEALCGRLMGSNTKRGNVYTWIPTHLADAFGRATPRSFITAFKVAAQDTDEKRNGYELPIHHDGIHEGVRKASEIRNAEINEDYPWAGRLLSALHGKSVLMDHSTFEQEWLPLLSQLPQLNRLPPRNFSVNTELKGTVDALLRDLCDLGISYQAEDGRYNIVDIYRLSAGIGRKGGVKPPVR